MDCDLIRSEVVHRSGKPYWVCSREGCDRKCVSADGICKVGECKSTDPVAIAEAQAKALAAPKKCLPCQKKAYGLGDLVADGIKAATFGLVKPCGGCKERQKKLNDLLPNINPFGSTEA